MPCTVFWNWRPSTRTLCKGYEGPECQWRDVHDELATLSLFDASHHRIALVRDADKFIYRQSPCPRTMDRITTCRCNSIAGSVELSGTTKLYKQVAAKGMLVQCSPPVTSGFGNPVDEGAVLKWLQLWAKKRHKIQIENRQATLILDRTGAELGIIDCELAKLALFADERGHISDDQIREMVGGWRTQTIWKIVELIASGRAAEAIEQQDRLFTGGQNALGIFAPLSWSMRRFGVAAHLVEQAERNGTRVALPLALEKAGFRRTRSNRPKRNFVASADNAERSYSNGCWNSN